MKRSAILPAAIVRVAAIVERETGEGRPIPPTDEMVRECGVSRGTVERALRRLRTDGVISMKRRTTAPAAGFSYRDDDEWDMKVRKASDILLAAIRLHHPERVVL